MKTKHLTVVLSVLLLLACLSADMALSASPVAAEPEIPPLPFLVSGIVRADGQVITGAHVWCCIDHQCPWSGHTVLGAYLIRVPNGYAGQTLYCRATYGDLLSSWQYWRLNPPPIWKVVNFSM